MSVDLRLFHAVIIWCLLYNFPLVVCFEAIFPSRKLEMFVFRYNRLVLRILPPANFKVQCELGNKFGCHPQDARSLLLKAQELDLNVVGIR